MRNCPYFVYVTSPSELTRVVMPEVVKSVLVAYTPAEMFTLVDGVEHYPSFLPWCGGSELHSRDESITEATIHICYLQVKQQFSTCNTKRFPEFMALKLKDGPFRALDGEWRFKALGDAACKIEFRLRYEFSSSLLAKLLGPVFGHIADTLVDAFVRRAEEVYGVR
jgi:ribosome-associated toxin RatA of RatAB toxin-antitoxin module